MLTLAYALAALALIALSGLTVGGFAGTLALPFIGEEDLEEAGVQL